MHRAFEIEARLNNRERRFNVPAARFSGMGWHTEYLGASAIVYPGLSSKDHARTAIQMLSGQVDERRVFTHTGWREVDGEWVYLHAGGAIGPAGRLEGIEVLFEGYPSLYSLPDLPGEVDLKQAIRASLRTWEVAPDGLVIPQHAAAYRAALGSTDFGLHIVGPTGEGKSEVAALSARHFGSGLDARHLLSWESTDNAVEGQAFVLKDSLMILDDFAPSGTIYDAQRWHKKADRIFRGKGNASGRSRMGQNQSMRPTRTPRALIISTGEDTPRGQSLRARMFVLEHGEGEVDWQKLTACQQDGDEGLYALAMAGFISFLAKDYERIRERLSAERQQLREEASRDSQHKRTPGIAADLGLGLKYFLEYAEEVRAITPGESADLWERGWESILKAAAKQGNHQVASEPARRFVELISSAIASGRAHIAVTSGERPIENAGALGWRKTGSEYADWRPQGDRIGWAHGDDLYLEPAASYRVAQREAQGGEALAVGERTIRRRLKEKGLLLSIDEKRQTLTVRRTIEGVKDRSVLHLRLGSLFSHREQPDEPDAEGEDPPRNGGSDPNPSSGSGANFPKPDERTDKASGFRVNPQVTRLEPNAEDRLSSAEGAGDRQVRRVLEKDKAPPLSEGAGVEDQIGDLTGSEGSHELVKTQDQLETFTERLESSGTVAVDLETVGLNPATLRVRIISITIEEGTWLVDCSATDPSPLLPALTGKTLIFHNALFDLTILVLMGLDLGRVGEVVDTLVMSRIVADDQIDTKEDAA